MYKFALGALVVLETSRAAYFRQLEEEAEDRRIEALPEAERPVGVATLRAREPIEQGTIIGRGEYADDAPHRYLVRYRDGAGCQKEEWFTPDAIFEPEVVTRDEEAPAGEERPAEQGRSGWDGFEHMMAGITESTRRLLAASQPRHLLLFGGAQPRTFRGSMFGPQSTQVPTEAEGFAEIYERAYKAERESDDGTPETAARAANEAVTLFVAVTEDARERAQAASAAPKAE